MTKKQQGLAVRKRRPTSTRSNQYVSNPKQAAFLEALFNSSNPLTFGNYYQSALSAGFNDSYARNIMTIRPKWLSEYIENLLLDETSITKAITDIALTRPDSKSPDDTRLRALELLAKLRGMLINRVEVDQKIVRISLDIDSQQG